MSGISIFALGAAFVFGTCIGSFLNVLIWRLPREKSIQGRSECPHCKHQLFWYDLIPVFSFLFSGARCRYCQKPVSSRYPIIEIITGLLFALATYYFYTPYSLLSTVELLSIFVVLAVCVVVFVIDLEHYLILDRVVYPAAIIILGFDIILSLIAHNPYIILNHLLAALAAIPFWLMWYVSKGKWMGFGDVKFVALMGLMLGFPGVLVALFASFILGAAIGVGLIAGGKKEMGSKVPFGTFLSIATLLAMFFWPQLWSWYWGLFAVV